MHDTKPMLLLRIRPLEAALRWFWTASPGLRSTLLVPGFSVACNLAGFTRTWLWRYRRLLISTLPAGSYRLIRNLFRYFIWSARWLNVREQFISLVRDVRPKCCFLALHPSWPFYH